MGCELVIHTVVTGGQALEETIAGFSQLAGQFTEQVSFVVWLNPYFGPVERERTGFEQFEGIQRSKGSNFGDCKDAAARRIVSARSL